MEQNEPIFYDVISPNEFIDCFDIEDIENTYPIQIVSTGKRYFNSYKNRNTITYTAT